MSENMIEVKCPRCGQKTIYSSVNNFRPFCSERCKLIDLGDWASNKFAIPTSEKVDPNCEIPASASNKFPSNEDDEEL